MVLCFVLFVFLDNYEGWKILKDEKEVEEEYNIVVLF